MSFLPSNLSLHNKRKGEKGPPLSKLTQSLPVQLFRFALDNRRLYSPGRWWDDTFGTLQSGGLWQLPPVMVTTQVSRSTARESETLKNIETKRSQNNVPHSKAGLNFRHWPSTISYLTISLTSFPPEVPYSIPLPSPWGKWLTLPSGCLLPDTPALLSLDLSTFPYLYLVNNKHLVTNIQYLVWHGHDSGDRNGEP